MSRLRPVVGNWYQEANQGFLFEVVAFDEEDQTIEIQHLEGEVEEYDLDSWQELELQPVAPPEDWRTAYELSEEDARDPDAPLQPDDWSGALSQVEPDDIGLDEDYWND